ncbi:MAG: hypothetical protein AVDCRST_MAG28-215, partial [uncultured Rubrobacteraceae bacterium]
GRVRTRRKPALRAASIRFRRLVFSLPPAGPEVVLRKKKAGGRSTLALLDSSLFLPGRGCPALCCFPFLPAGHAVLRV